MATEPELETMRPNPAWAEEPYQDAVDAFADRRDRITVRVWGGDWCSDCRSQLPDFGAALEAADIPDDRVEHYPVEKADDGSKAGPKVDEYGIELIPTVVVEVNGEEVARFVEEGDAPIAVALAEQLETEDAA
jgi:thiol-disulfide isomerase/thioredoxin